MLFVFFVKTLNLCTVHKFESLTVNTLLGFTVQQVPGVRSNGRDR